MQVRVLQGEYGLADVMALHEFFAANEDAFPCTEERRQIEAHLERGAMVVLGGGASPFVTLSRKR